jgi:cell wall-associated NlpC family hydrolase
MRKVIMGAVLLFALNGQIQATKIINTKHKLTIIGVEKVTAPSYKFGEPTYWNSKEKSKKVANQPKFKTHKKLTKKSNVKESCKLSKVGLLETAKKYLGIKYRYGGTTRKGIDCSAFVRSVYSKHKVKLPRTSREQFKKGKHIAKSKAKKGDLIFFRGEHSKSVGHVGIIIDPKRKLMIHASSGAKKVTISNYEKSYYRNHFKGIRRIT